MAPGRSAPLGNYQVPRRPSFLSPDHELIIFFCLIYVTNSYFFVFNNRYFEGLASKSESEEEKKERINREKFTQELFFSLMSPVLEKADTNSESQQSEAQAKSSSSGTKDKSGDLVKDVQRKFDELDFHCDKSAGGESSQEQCSGYAAAAESANVVVTKVCSDIESDALYTSQSSESDTSVS